MSTCNCDFCQRNKSVESIMDKYRMSPKDRGVIKSVLLDAIVSEADYLSEKVKRMNPPSDARYKHGEWFCESCGQKFKCTSEALKHVKDCPALNHGQDIRRDLEEINRIFANSRGGIMQSEAYK